MANSRARDEDRRILERVRKRGNQLENALKKAGKEYDYKIMPGLGHGFWNYTYSYYDLEKETEVYDAVLAFLDKHMK